MSGDKSTPKIVIWLESIAAIFLAAITALSFVAVILRYIFSYVIPDSFDVGRLLLGVCIFWGIATANYRDEHIGMDLVWSMAGKTGRRIIDIAAGLVTFAAFGVFTWMFSYKLLDVWQSGETTFDLHMPLSIFYGLAWLGVAAGIFLLALRIWRLITRPAEAGEKGADALMMD